MRTDSKKISAYDFMFLLFHPEKVPFEILSLTFCLIFSLTSLE